VSELYDLEAARSPEQRAYMAGLEARGVCIFCPEHVAAEQRLPIEHTGSTGTSSATTTPIPAPSSTT